MSQQATQTHQPAQAPPAPQGGILQRKCACGNHTVAGSECTECRKQRVSLQRKAANHAEPTAVPPIVHEVLREPGRPLDPVTRAFMEPPFEHDFSQVRVHTDEKAAESTRAVRALAYAVGSDIVFRTGLYRPDTDSGQRLLVHELTHTAQQRQNNYPKGFLELSHPSDKSEREASKAATEAFAAGPIAASPVSLHIAREPDPTAIADQVIEKESLVSPVAGVGDHPAAFKILSSLDSATLLQVFVVLDERAYLEMLLGNIGAATTDQDRLETAIHAVLYGRRGLPSSLARGFTLFQALSPTLRTEISDCLEKNFGTHKRVAFTAGEEAETARLATLQLASLEDKRRKSEEAARTRAEAEAKAKGTAPPSKAPTVDIGKTLEGEVKSRAIPPISTDEWDKLSDADKKDWTDKRAPVAFSKLTASIKGTELEKVMRGHDFKFKPREMLERGGYAFQDGNDLVGGMTFIKDIERDPKNVWGLIAHEIGGHFAYGETYAKKIMDKVLAKLPEAERKKWTEGKAAVEFFDAFLYAETEIFAALRQRRYDVPESGPAPTHGAIKPDENIETRLKAIDTAYPKEVAHAILIELNTKVQTDSAILDRDKKYFLDQVRKHGYSL